MKSNEQLINNILGQLEGIKKMMVARKSCKEVIVQLKAVRASMDAMTRKYLYSQMKKCVNSEKGKNNYSQIETIVAELIRQ